jgi:hypothetical protein
MGRFDEKFRYAPGAAFEISLVGVAVMGFLGALSFAGAVAFFTRRSLAPTGLGLGLASVFGGIYITLPEVLYWRRVDTPAGLFWICVALFPIFAARLTLHRVGSPNQVSCPMPDSRSG